MPGSASLRRPHGAPGFIAFTLAILLVGGLSACQADSAGGAAPHRGSRSARAVATSSYRENGHLTRLCGQAGWPEARVGHGAYVVQNDEWNSTTPECITTNGSPQFTVTSSSIDMPVSGDPGGYPSIYSGCSAGVCTAGNKLPIQVSALKPGMVTSNWTTVQPPSGAYDATYDIWFNHAPASSEPPDGGELMIWLAHHGGRQIAPGGNPVANVTIGDHAYTVWWWPGSAQADARISYVLNRATLSVHDLDISAFAADAARRGYLAGSSYLLNIQAGFELWQGGAGLETKSFTISVRRPRKRRSTGHH